MADIDFNGIKNDIISQVSSLAVGAFKDRKEEIIKDTEDFVKESEEKLKEWAVNLAKGEITAGEFKLLLTARADLLKMTALTQAGLTLVAVDNLRQGILDTVVSVVKKAVLPAI